MKYRTGYAGEGCNELIEVPDTITNEELDEWAWEGAVEHAQSYGREMCTDDCRDDECEMEHPGNTNIEGSWEPYDPEKHYYIL